MLYVIYSLEVIKHQLGELVQENEEVELISNEEIEKELEEMNK